MAIRSDQELAELPSMASLLELERLNLEAAVLRDCAASLAKERDRGIATENGWGMGEGAVVRFRTVSA
jgi:hypothetical protein